MTITLGLTSPALFHTQRQGVKVDLGRFLAPHGSFRVKSLYLTKDFLKAEHFALIQTKPMPPAPYSNIDLKLLLWFMSLFE